MTITNKTYYRHDYANKLRVELLWAFTNSAETGYFDSALDFILESTRIRIGWHYRDDPAHPGISYFTKFTDLNTGISREATDDEQLDALNSFFSGLQSAQYLSLTTLVISKELLESSVEDKPALGIANIRFDYSPKVIDSKHPHNHVSHSVCLLKLEDDRHALEYMLGPNGHHVDQALNFDANRV